jgi:hypothetical protein
MQPYLNIAVGALVDKLPKERTKELIHLYQSNWSLFLDTLSEAGLVVSGSIEDVSLDDWPECFAFCLKGTLQSLKKAEKVTNLPGYSEELLAKCVEGLSKLGYEWKDVEGLVGRVIFVDEC